MILYRFVIYFLSVILLLLYLFLFLYLMWGILLNILLLLNTILLLIVFVCTCSRFAIDCWNRIANNICCFGFFCWCYVIVESKLITILYLIYFNLSNFLWSTKLFITFLTATLFIRWNVLSAKLSQKLKILFINFRKGT